MRGQNQLRRRGRARIRWIGINDIGNNFYLPGDRDAYASITLDALRLIHFAYFTRFSDALLNAYFVLVQKLVCSMQYLTSFFVKHFPFFGF